MQILSSNINPDLATMLNGYDYPAILVTADYHILATNKLYLENFGEIHDRENALCHRVSHGYDVPCDQAGENCPLTAALLSRRKERVLHIHQTPRGKEHVDVEMLPITDEKGNLKYFVELLKPVTVTSPQLNKNEFVGNSPAFNKMLENILKVAVTEASVLLLGESGTGKEIAALAIHNAGNRSEKSIVTLECSGLTETLFESELFGHVKGAFTGASYNKQGLVEAANGGTLFLDEIGDVPLDLQVKLLRLIETGTYRQVGSEETRHSDFRLICATHKDIFAMVQRGEFRQDLFYRINVFPISMPSLNERKSDVPILAKAILKRLDKSGKYTLADTALKLLQNHHYAGNIRELRNMLARAIVLANHQTIDDKVIKQCIEIERDFVRKEMAFPDLKTNEKHYLEKLLQSCEGDKERAASIAKISVRSLYRKLHT